jgi:hypothetical protein
MLAIGPLSEDQDCSVSRIAQAMVLELHHLPT